MGLRSRRHQAARVFALLAALSASSGCRWLPVHRVDRRVWPGRESEATEPRNVSATETASANLPPLPKLRPVSDEEALADSTTPLLDAAYARAELAQSVVRDTPAIAPTPVSEPPRPLALPVKAPTAAPVDEAVVTAASSATPEPADPWREGIARLRALAHEKASGEGRDAEDWELRDRLLAWLVDESGEGESDAWQVVLSALSSPVVPPIDEAIVESTPKVEEISIPELRLCRLVAGFGNFQELEKDEIRAGEPVIAYWEVAGLRYEGETPALRSRLGARLELLAVDQPEAIWKQDLGIAEDTCRRPRRDYYVNYRLILPAGITPGPYRLRLTIRDDVACSVSERILPITVRP